MNADSLFSSLGAQKRKQKWRQVQVCHRLLHVSKKNQQQWALSSPSSSTCNGQNIKRQRRTKAHHHLLQEKTTMTSPHFVVVSSIGEGEDKPPSLSF
jgi:hypothetical protein